jgi:general secretion pathway protein A
VNEPVYYLHMYPQFFGIDKLPFRLRPDADFLYSGEEYLRARVNILAALHGSSRVVLLMGPPGVGKTMLLEDVLREITGQFVPCRINQPHISATELLQALLLQLRVPTADAEMNRSRPLAELTASLGRIDVRDVAPLVVVDDAQLLAGSTLGVFGELLARAPRMKMMLALRNGQPFRVEEFVSRMAVPEEPRQVQLGPFTADATKAYIERRLAVAGGARKELFAADAYAMIFQHTGGAARLVNVLCDAALHAACMRASGLVGAAEILLATQDSRWPEAVARNKAGPIAAAEEAAASAPVAPARLYVSLGAEHLAAWPLTAGRLAIGRSADNELQLEASFVSRHHCQVVTVGNVSTIEDLGSVNGVCVNGKSVKRHILQHKDQITLGEHVLTYLVS